MAKSVRKIVKIDEAKCDGCGLCIGACVEGALRIIDGKARLISENYCDGLGACLGECPRDAITVEDGEAEAFTGEAPRESATPVKAAFAGCPSTRMLEFETPENDSAEKSAAQSALRHWPVQLALLPPSALFLKGADLLLTADCVPFALASFHERLLRGHALAVACPKLDDCEAHLDKLTAILRVGGLKSLTVAIMEVPCCSGLLYLAKQALAASGSTIPLNQIVIGTRGEILSGLPSATPHPDAVC